MTKHSLFSRRKPRLKAQPTPPIVDAAPRPDPPKKPKPKKRRRRRKPLLRDGKTTDLSIVIITWHREAELLHNSLETLSKQTILPREIVVVDMNTGADYCKKNAAVVAEYPLARIVSGPIEQFNMSWGFNVGIKATQESHYVMTTCMELFFGPNVIECIMDTIDDGTLIMSPCGFLPENVDVSGDVWERWRGLIKLVKPNPPKPISGGTLFCIRRSWWFEFHGYDEKRPFAYTDSDVQRRTMDTEGITKRNLMWAECQVLHPWHKRSELVSKLGGRWPLPHEKHILVNKGGWGELK